MTTVWKALADQGVSLGTANILTFQSDRWNISCISRPLMVLDMTQSYSRTFLKSVSTNMEWGLTNVLFSEEMVLAQYRNPIWLLLAPKIPHHLLKSIHVPFDCHMLVAHNHGDQINITEVFHVAEPYNELFSKWPYDRGPRKRVETAVWGSFGSRGLNTTVVPMYERRMNLMGMKMRAVAFNNFPFTLVHGKGRNTTVDGFVGQVWSILEQQMNFTTEFHNYRKNTMVEAGRYVFDRKVQVTLFDFTVTWRIIRQLDFTLPLFSSRYGIYIRRPSASEVGWTVFLKPFHCTMWLATVMCGLVVYVLLTGMYRGVPTGHGAPHTFLPVWAAFFNQSTSIPQRPLACQVVLATSRLTTIVLLAAYSARLIASLATRESNLPFTNVEGLLAHESYWLGAVKGDDAHMILETTTHPTLEALFNKSILNNTTRKLHYPANISQALHWLCTKPYAHMMQVDYALAYAKSAPCDIAVLPDFSMPVSVGIVLTKANPYLGLFNHYILKMGRSGLLQKLFNDARPKKLPVVEKTYPMVALGEVKSILLALALGTAAALSTMGFELYRGRRKQRTPTIA